MAPDSKVFPFFFLRPNDLIINIKHRRRCSALFQESVSGDFGCNWGEATKRLAWRCIWNTWVIRDAVEEFAGSYSLLQHPLKFSRSCSSSCCPPHPVFCRLQPMTFSIYALHVPAPHRQTSSLLFLSFSYKTPGAAGGLKRWRQSEDAQTSQSQHLASEVTLFTQ